MRFIAALALAAVAASAIDAAAQPSDATESVARRYFNDGVVAYRAGDFVKARDLFARAHELVPGRDLVLFNLASAQARTDQLVEATRSFQKFLAATTAEGQPAYRAKATAELADLEKRTPSVIIAVTNLAGGDRVTLGGEPFARALLGEEVPANPGAVKVAVLRDGAVVATGEAQLSEGDKRVAIEIRAPLDLEVKPKPKPAAPVSPPPSAPPDDRATDSSVLSSPWFWIAAVTVACAAGGTGYYFLVYRPEHQPDPSPGTLGAGIEF